VDSSFSHRLLFKSVTGAKRAFSLLQISEKESERMPLSKCITADFSIGACKPAADPTTTVLTPLDIKPPDPPIQRVYLRKGPSGCTLSGTYDRTSQTILCNPVPPDVFDQVILKKSAGHIILTICWEDPETAPDPDHLAITSLSVPAQFTARALMFRRTGDCKEVHDDQPGSPAVVHIPAAAAPAIHVHIHNHGTGGGMGGGCCGGSDECDE